MKVSVKLVCMSVEKGKDAFDVELPDTAAIDDLLNKLCAETSGDLNKELSDRKHMSVLVNEQLHLDHDFELHDGDAVKIFRVFVAG